MKTTIDKLLNLKTLKYLSNYKIIDITYDKKELIKFKEYSDIKFKRHFLKLGCPLYLYLVISNNQNIILLKYKTIKYHYEEQITYFLNNCKIFYDKDLEEWKEEQNKLKIHKKKKKIKRK